MPLLSEFFKGDRALERCQVLDSAHVLSGAVGDHVNKIQVALVVLDSANLARGELDLKRYGPSTAAAVLAYKKKRRIINPAYQSQADDIVGKMTIDRLDREMLARERRSRGRPSCGDEIRGGGDGVVAKAAAPTKASRAGLTASPVRAVTERLPLKTLSMHWQHTAHPAAAAANQALFSLLVQQSIALLMPFNMRLSSNANIAERIPHTGIVRVNHASADVVRRVAEQVARPNPKSIRVIVCPFPDGDPAFAFTSGRGFDPTFQGSVDNYILLNANKRREDRCTLIHEMVHAATNLGEDRHDPANTGSIFSVDSTRTLLKPEHALALNQAFFAA